MGLLREVVDEVRWWRGDPKRGRTFEGKEGEGAGRLSGGGKGWDNSRLSGGGKGWDG